MVVVQLLRNAIWKFLKWILAQFQVATDCNGAEAVGQRLGDQVDQSAPDGRGGVPAP